MIDLVFDQFLPGIAHLIMLRIGAAAFGAMFDVAIDRHIQRKAAS